MVTLQQLKRQRDALRQRDEAMREKKKLQKEIKDLRNPLTSAFKKNFKRGLKIGGRKTLRFLDNATRPVSVRSPRRTKKKGKRR